jgi:hypothetical protein
MASVQSLTHPYFFLMLDLARTLCHSFCQELCTRDPRSNNVKAPVSLAKNLMKKPYTLTLFQMEPAAVGKEGKEGPDSLDRERTCSPS